MNEAEKKLRAAWAKADKDTRDAVCDWPMARESKYDALGSAVRAFCESEPVEGGGVELLRVTLDSTRRQLDQTTELLKAQGITLAAAEKERDDARSALAVARDARDQNQRALGFTHSALDLANESRDRAQRERDKLKGDHRYACEVLSRTSIKLGEAKREAEAMRAKVAQLESVVESQKGFLSRAMESKRDLDAAKRSYSTQLADLQRALEAEKKAHGEALKSQSRPERAVDRDLREALKGCAHWTDEDCFVDYGARRAASALKAWLAAPLSAADEYTRAAVACAEALADARVSYSGFEPIRERWQEIYTARQRGEPSAPVSSQPPARVLECWLSEYDDGEVTVGFGCAKDALRSNGVLRAHRVALPVIETVERGA